MNSNKSNGGDRVVRTLRVFESGRVVPSPGRPPRDWAAIVNRARAHALPAEERPAPVERVKNPAKVAAGKARAAQAAARKAAEASKLAAVVTVPAAKKAPAKAASKPKARAKPAAKAKPATKAARGGKRAGSGPKPANGAAMVVVAHRVTPAQKKKLDKLGPNWLRARIDAATVSA